MNTAENKAAYPKAAGFPGVKDGERMSAACGRESEMSEVQRSIADEAALPARKISGTAKGETFQLAGFEFIKFPGTKDGTPAVMRNIAFNSRFGDNNDLRSSDVLKKLESEILPKIVAAIGEENVRTIHTDLTTLDGLKPYGVMESKISLPTLDFYRANLETFDKYPVDGWWWLATPESAKPHDDPFWTLCVSPSGFIFNNLYYYYRSGVRPFLIFESSIFESSNE